MNPGPNPCTRAAEHQSITEIEMSPHKYLQVARQLSTLAAGGDIFPVTVEIDPVDYCNHRCGWCVDPQHGTTELALKTLRSLLDELHELGVKGVVLKGGGEPTLHAEFGTLLELAAGHGFEIGVVSNGSRLSLVGGAIANQASYLRVSMDGPTRASHQAVHGSQDFERIVEGVAEVVAQRAARRHPIIGLSFAMDHAAINLVGEAIALGERLGVDYVLLRTPFFEEVGRTPTMTVEEARAVRHALDEGRRTYGGSMRILVDHWVSDREASRFENLPVTSPRRGSAGYSGANGIEHLTGRCWASPLLAVVASDQTVFPCCNLRALEPWAIGRLDYDRGITFRTLWEGQQRRQVMDRIHRVECLRHCTHPMSKYNEAIEYLRGPRYHGGFL
jgi:hypothetical protein